jgi:molecular chaperone GrpE
MTDSTGSGGGASDSEGAGEAARALDNLLTGGAGAASQAQPQAPENPLAGLLAAAEKERDDLKDQLLRSLAETENIRKRANKQIADEKLYAVERFARDLLAVSDYMAKAVETAPAEGRAGLPDQVRTLLDGVDLTQKELHAVFARHGVTAIDAAPGAAFDPNAHQAVAQIPSDQPAGAVAQLFQAGWKIGDRVLRAAMVAVSLGPKV